MVDIAIVNGIYKPTYHWVAPSRICSYFLFHLGWGSRWEPHCHGSNFLDLESLHIGFIEKHKTRLWSSNGDPTLVRIPVASNIYICMKLYVLMHIAEKMHQYIYIGLYWYNYRRKFRSQTSDNVDRWKSRDGKRQREEKSRREQIREVKESKERRRRCAKR